MQRAEPVDVAPVARPLPIQSVDALQLPLVLGRRCGAAGFRADELGAGEAADADAVAPAVALDEGSAPGSPAADDDVRTVEPDDGAGRGMSVSCPRPTAWPVVVPG